MGRSKLVGWFAPIVGRLAGQALDRRAAARPKHRCCVALRLRTLRLAALDLRATNATARPNGLSFLRVGNEKGTATGSRQPVLAPNVNLVPTDDRTMRPGISARAMS